MQLKPGEIYVQDEIERNPSHKDQDSKWSHNTGMDEGLPH